jgi:thymidylate synthase (FAD)
MNIINAGYEIMSPINGMEILKHIEKCGRVCYKSEDKITDESCIAFIKNVLKRGHESVIEHFSFTVKFITDRGVSHEIVRHRLASYSQESSRYCNYGNSDNGCTFIKPLFRNTDSIKYENWLKAISQTESAYLALLSTGATAQEARSVLPNSLKTEVIMTANLREWRHFFKMRADKPAHPQMREIAIPLLLELRQRIPVIFDDILPEITAESK